MISENCREIIQDKSLKLRGAKYNIIGRSIVVHAGPYDLGKGGDEESLKTGNAGATNRMCRYWLQNRLLFLKYLIIIYDL